MWVFLGLPFNSRISFTRFCFDSPPSDGIDRDTKEDCSLNTNQTNPSKKDVLIIGAGGVAQVVAHKCAMHNDVLGEIHIASRTQDKCDAIAQSVKEKNSFKLPAYYIPIKSMRWIRKR